MRRVALTTPEDKERFARKFAERTPNPLPDWLLSQSDAIGFEEGGNLIGGFLINRETPYRYVDMIPTTHCDTPHVRLYLSDGMAVELICMWLDHARMTRVRRTRIYLTAIFMAYGLRRRWVLAGSVSERVAALHKNGFRHMVYCGPTTFPGGPYGEIYAARPYELILNFPKAFCIDMAGRLRKRWRGRRRLARAASDQSGTTD